MQDQILRESYNPSYGARPMRRYVDKHVSTEVAKLVVAGRLKDCQDVLVDAAPPLVGAGLGHFTFSITDAPTM